MPVKRHSSFGAGGGRTKKAKISPRTTSLVAEHSGAVLTLGMNDVGQLGLGVDVMQKNRPAFVSSLEDDVVIICAGGMHTICATSDGKVSTFGCNDEGALGRDTSEEGSETEPGFVDLEGSVVQVSAGDNHSAALLADGRVFAWGSFRDSHGTMGFLTEGVHEKLPKEVLPGEVVVKIASGENHLLMLTREGHLFSFGCGEQGQLGRVPERTASRGSRQGLSHLLEPGLVAFKPRTRIIEDIWAGTYASFAKCQDQIYVFGLNNYMQLGLDNKASHFHPVLSTKLSGHTWEQICGGPHHTLARDNAGIVHVLGRYEYGRLGLGKDSGDAENPITIPVLSKKKCVDIACGSAVSFAVTDKGEVYGWGMGTNGQLGNDESDIYEPTIIQGRQLETRKASRVSAGGQHTVILATTGSP